MDIKEQLNPAQTNEAADTAATGTAEPGTPQNPQEEGTSAQFTDSSNVVTEDDKGKSEQTKEQNSEYARRRRDEERKKELADARANARTAAFIEALNGKNPYTEEEMKDAHDVEEYLEMREIEKNGGDPVADFAKHHREKVKELAKAKEEKDKRDEWFETDRQAFISKYPDINLDELIQNPEFIAFAKGKVGETPLAEIYADYIGFVSEIEKKANAKAAQTLANSKATPGSLSSPGTSEAAFYTKEQVTKMSKDEIRENWDKVQESMRKWK